LRHHNIGDQFKGAAFEVTAFKQSDRLEELSFKLHVLALLLYVMQLALCVIWRL